MDPVVSAGRQPAYPLAVAPRRLCRKGDHEMVRVIASIHVREGQLTKFIEIFKSNVPDVLKEKGCIEYVPTIDLPAGLPRQEVNNNIVTIVEKWRSFEDLQAHLSSPHMLAYQKKVKDLVEKVSLKVLAEA
jgi:quinol monooxygenase YgiN